MRKQSIDSPLPTGLGSKITNVQLPQHDETYFSAHNRQLRTRSVSGFIFFYLQGSTFHPCCAISADFPPSQAYDTTARCLQSPLPSFGNACPNTPIRATALPFASCTAPSHQRMLQKGHVFTKLPGKPPAAGRLIAQQSPRHEIHPGLPVHPLTTDNKKPRKPKACGV